jgi:hypothetical protein
MPPEPSSVSEILARTRAVYATCQTYRDEGSVVTRVEPLTPAHGPSTSRKPFATWFVRPERFRFEYASETIGPPDEWDRMVILWNQEGVRSTWTIQEGVSVHDSVHAAIGCATGVSAGTAYTVPTLLVPGGTGRDPLDAREVEYVGRRDLEGRECLLLRRMDRTGSKTLWIGCADHLLHRIEEEKVFDEQVLRELQAHSQAYHRSLPSEERMLEEGRESDGSRPFRMRSVTSYRPVIDGPIDARPFESLRSLVVVPELPAPVLRPTDASVPPATEILAQVRRAYASCGTFRAAGQRTTVSIEKDGSRRHTSKYAFTFAFQRPERLRFENAFVDIGPEEDWSRFVTIWNAGRSLWIDRGGQRRESEGASMSRLGREFLPMSLLISDAEGADRLPDSGNTEVLGLADVDGHECVVVRGTRADGIELTLWISRVDGLVRKCIDVHVFDDRWREAQRLDAEKHLSQARSEEERKAIELAIEHLSKPQAPYHCESTTTLDPRPDIELDPGLFRID